MLSGQGVSGHLPSERSTCLTDTECQGKCLPDNAYYGISLPDEECQGICLLDIARAYRHRVSRQMSSGQGVSG